MLIFEKKKKKMPCAFHFKIVMVEDGCQEKSIKEQNCSYVNIIKGNID